MTFRHSVKEILLENWGVKLAALLLAAILWLVVRGDPTAERVITVPLEVLIPRNMQITSERPSTVDVTIRGIITDIWFGQTVPTCRVDLQGADEGEHVVQLSPDDVRLPRASGLEVIAVRPARIRLVLEWTTSKEVPIRAVLGETPPGLDVYGAFLSPSQVVVAGPRSRVDRLKEIPTQPIPLTGQQQSFRAFVNLNISDAAVYASPKGPIQVDIQLGTHRRLHIIRAPIVSEDPNVTVTPSRISVHVLVPMTFRRILTAADLIASVSAQGLDSSNPAAKAKPHVVFKEQVDPAIVIREIQPSEVTIRRR